MRHHCIFPGRSTGTGFSWEKDTIGGVNMIKLRHPDKTMLDHRDYAVIAHDIQQIWWRMEVLHKHQMKQHYEQEFQGRFDHTIPKADIAFIKNTEWDDIGWFIKRIRQMTA